MAFTSRKRSDSYSDSAGQMGFGLDPKKSSRSSKMVNSAFTSQVRQNLKQQEDKLKGKDRSSKVYADRVRARKESSTSTGNLRKESVEAKTRREDELVKYMSNLPGYLQHLGKEEKIQENAFNVGVLDWSRLEKWKGNQRRDSADDRSNSSIAGVNVQSTKMSNKLSSLPKAVYSEDHSYPSASSGRNSSCSDSISSRTKSVVGDSLQYQDSEINSRSNLVADKRVPRTHKTYSKNDSVGVVEKRKETGLEQRNSPKVRPRDDPNVRRSEANNRYETKIKDPNQKAVASTGSFPSKLWISDIPPNLKESWKTPRGKTKKQMEDLQKSCTSRSSGPEPVDKRSIVYLWPRKVSEDGPSKNQPRVSLDEIPKKPVQCSYSGRFSHVEVDSFMHSLEIPRTCPLDSMMETNVQPHKETTAVEQQSELPHNPKILSVHQAEMSNDTATDLNASDTKTTEGKTADLVARKCRHPSPNRRLSFSLSQMARSLSSKESSSVPQLNSTYVSVKSGPITSNAFGSNNDSNKEKGSVPNRARSSPLRRILDPLLKSKGSTTNFPLKSFSFRPLNAIEPIDGERCDTLSVQAHLQIMIKNGLPLLRFVVDNNSSILVATKMNVTSSVKNDLGCYYTFYSIDEVKKKGGSWINQSSKEKSCGFVYNVVGQMRINSSCSSDSNRWYPINDYTIKESVLFGVEVGQVDGESTKLRPTREIAAIVVRIPCEGHCHDQVEDWMDNSFTSSMSMHNFQHSSGRKGPLNITTVILPGGIHGLPDKGIPSPLIHRWTSGGSCDCGGWDVGCKLNVLSNEVHQSQSSRTSDSHSMSEHFELFLQGRGQQDKPLFSMTLLEKGLYSVEFSPSISLLQAFFVCITTVSCQSSPDLPEVGNSLDEKHLFEEKVHQEFSTRNERNCKIYTSVVGEAPSKYAPSPPFSPVGRV